MPIVDCDIAGWGFTLFSHLQQRQEADLINARFGTHAGILHDFAHLFCMALEYEPRSQTARFREVQAGPNPLETVGAEFHAVEPIQARLEVPAQF